MERSFSFGYWVRRRRKALDLTQDALARRVGCALSTIRKIESDERRPSREFAERLADLLEIAPAERVGFLKAARAEIAPDQLAAPTADIAAPSQPARSTRLPAPPTPLVGRADELAQASALLGDGPARLLTLTGPGGVGKTRLALALAETLIDTFENIWFVPLAPIRDAELVPSAIAQALEVKEQGSQPVLDGVKNALHEKNALLVLDNFEQVTKAARLIAELLQSASHLKIIVTSREPLHLAAEHEFPVPTLALPPRGPRAAPEELGQFAAVELFAQRARAVKPGFVLSNTNAAAVAELCARLDGLPLAIELAAARTKMFAPPALLARLQKRFGLLTGGALDLPTRHQALRAAIDWSYELLGAGERTLFARLGVFVGGCTLDAAEAVCNAGGDLATYVFDWLAALVDKSLVRQEDGPDGEPRFLMLETIREYALERLEASGESEALHEAHASYFLALAEQAEPELTGPQQIEWLERLEREHDNLRATLTWAQEHSADEMLARIAGALWRFWQIHGHLREGRKWLENALEQSNKLNKSLCAKVSLGTGILALTQNDAHHAHECMELSSALYMEAGDLRNLALALTGLGEIAIHDEDYTQATKYFEEGLALRRQLQDTWGIGGSLISLGVIAINVGENERAITLLTESLALFRQVEEKRGIATILGNLALIAYRQGDFAKSSALAEECIILMQALGNKRMIAWALTIIGQNFLAQSNIEQAQQNIARAITLYQEINDASGTADGFERLADVTFTRGNAERAVYLYGAASGLRERRQLPLSPVERSEQKHTFMTIRAQLGEAAFAAAWAAGRALSLDEAIAEALQSYDIES